jgi:hypothetical protein
MRRREVMRVMVVTVSALVLTSVSVGANKPDNVKTHPHGKKAAASHTEPGRDANIAVHVAFGSGDVQAVRTHYAPRFRTLPPGLQKKLARGGSLPPGWQKKVEPFPVTLERGLTPLPAGYSRGVFEAHAVIYNSRGMIVDAAVLF